MYAYIACLISNTKVYIYQHGGYKNNNETDFNKPAFGDTSKSNRKLKTPTNS